MQADCVSVAVILAAAARVRHEARRELSWRRVLSTLGARPRAIARANVAGCWLAARLEALAARDADAVAAESGVAIDIGVRYGRKRAVKHPPPDPKLLGVVLQLLPAQVAFLERRPFVEHAECVGSAVALQSCNVARGTLGAVVTGRAITIIIGVSGVVKACGALARVRTDCVVAFLTT